MNITYFKTKNNSIFLGIKFRPAYDIILEAKLIETKNFNYNTLYRDYCCIMLKVSITNYAKN
jgi:hypothetical protein